MRKERDAIGGQPREAHLVRDENEVGALFAKLLNHVEDLGGHFRIERGCRLIEEHDARLDCDGASNGDALTLTAGKGRRLFVRVSIELEAAKQLEGNVTGLGWRLLVYFFKWQDNVFECGEMRKKIEGLENNTNGAAITQKGRFLELNRFAVELDASTVWNFQSGQNPQKGCLAATGGADEDKAVRLLQVERYRIERQMRIEAFG